MENNIVQVIITDSLWIIIVVGWIFLVMFGLEADKPLSGGIPGHVNPDDEQHGLAEGWWGRFGELGSWLAFGLIALSLPFVLWWIFVIHP